jgi:Flp pilus assembly secretin CpaC
MKPSLLLIAVLASGLRTLTAAEPEIRLIRTECLIVRIPTKKAIALQPRFQDPAQVSNAHQEVLTMMQNGQAKLVDWPIVTTRSGNRAVSENNQEIRYPIDFEQPEVIVNPGPREMAFTPSPTAPAESEKPKAAARTASKEKPTILAAIPSSFETRNTGVTLELEPVISPDGKHVDVQVAPSHVTLLGYEKTKVTAEDYSVTVDQPKFESLKTSTNLTLKSGEPHLFGFYKLKAPADIVEMVILTATVVTVK